MMGRIVFFTLAFAILLVVGCAFTPPPKPEYFLLDPGKPASMKALRPAGAPATASVSFVDVAAPFASDGFVYQISSDRWEVDPYNQFLVSPADMMTSIVRNWTRDADLYVDVTEPGAGGGQDYMIDCDLTELYGDFRNSSAPVAVVTLVAQVFHHTNKGRVVVLRKTFRQRVPIAAPRPAALVAAWNEALRVELNLLLRAIAESQSADSSAPQTRVD